jgi:2-polyprenyl-3-methyl-5-hydroxy-6-metoxy-1,4-benzoquinol methylase
MDPTSESIGYWNQIYEKTSYSREIDVKMRDALMTARGYFQPGEGHKILDLGCGSGATSLFWAETGAQVTAIDNSSVAVASLGARAAQMGITNLKAVVGNAMEIAELGPFDFIFGAMILHHIEPFGQFAEVLRRSVSVNGKAFFYENNSASALLVWFRENIVGKMWVPKVGDKDEFPLSPQEVNLLRDYFEVKVTYPEMVFFQLASEYLLKKKVTPQFKVLDEFLYKHNIGRKYSYRQYLFLEGSPLTH